MRVDDIPLEIWGIILGNVRNPVPAPLTQPHRSALCQPDLVTCARVCKVFQQICTPLIYRVVVTDNLPNFLRDFDRPTRRKVLALTEKLFIEYWDNTPVVTYMGIMRGYKHAWYGLDEHMAVGRRIQLCGAELHRLISALTPFTNRNTREIFPRLKTIVISSVYGRQDGLWTLYDGYAGHIRDAPQLDYCTKIWENFLLSSNVEQWCFRHAVGPLSQSPSTSPCTGQGADNAAHKTFHFDNRVEMPSAARGSKIVWVSNVRSEKSWHQIVKRIGVCLTQLNAARASSVNMDKILPYEIDIYCSTARPGRAPPDSPEVNLAEVASKVCGTVPERLSVEQQRSIAEKLGEGWQERFRRNSGLQDKIRWFPSADSPICAACGCGPPS